VLLQEGGVHADFDVMLETTLDSFITPNLSFFAPRDIVVEWADEAFCLWNGIMGSAPGHPFLVKAIERLINLILNVPISTISKVTYVEEMAVQWRTGKSEQNRIYPSLCHVHLA
jgi:mannosyltransferase OCH1-like enzyme